MNPMVISYILYKINCSFILQIDKQLDIKYAMKKKRGGEEGGRLLSGGVYFCSHEENDSNKEKTFLEMNRTQGRKM